jgi:glycosyltransferase involved in cell wall biosynthesis
VEETRSLPQGITPVTWRGDDRSLSFDDYQNLKNEFSDAVVRIKPDLIHAGPIQRVAYLPALIDFHPLLTMSWGFDLLEDASRDERWQEVTRFVLQRSDWFTSDCQTTRDLAVAYGMDINRTTIFPWGVDLRLFNPDRRGIMRRQVGYEEDLLIVHTRSWEPRYGVDMALEGFWQAYQVAPNLRMFMLGGGSQEDLVKGFVKEKGLEDRILFSGYQQNEALAGYYQAADVYLSASHIDGSSVALMEAMACGCPPLVSNIPANLEWVVDGEQGWVFRDGYAGDLAQKLIHIARHRREVMEMGRLARQTAEAKADWEKNTKLLMQTYQNVWRYHNEKKE